MRADSLPARPASSSGPVHPHAGPQGSPLHQAPRSARKSPLPTVRKGQRSLERDRELSYWQSLEGKELVQGEERVRGKRKTGKKEVGGGQGKSVLM